MGLDQYATAIKGDDKVDIAYWRKHANLEGYMADLYAQRGGEGVFNCKEISLLAEDIDELERLHADLPTASGFFWGESFDEEIQQTAEFIDTARAYLKLGYEIFYTSWW